MDTTTKQKMAETLKMKTAFVKWAEANAIELPDLKNINLELVERSCCFTGHRQIGMPERELADKVLKLIERAVKEGYTHFICGGALGFDTIAAEQVLFLKSARSDITLEIVAPCNDQDKKWSDKQKRRYKAILEEADVRTIRDRPYNRYCMKWRNELMVWKSSLVIAYYIEGNVGGTKNTLDFATKNKRGILYVK